MKYRVRKYAIFLLTLCLLALAGCSQTKDMYGGISQYELYEESAAETASAEQEREKDVYSERADEIYDSLTMEEKVCQLVIARDSEGDGTPFKDVAENYPVGGVCMFRYSFKDLDASQVRAKIKEYNTHARIPMLVSVDEEGGSVVRVSANEKLRSSKFKSPSELYSKGGYEKIKTDTAEKSQFLRALGINVNFSPVADVVTDENGFLYKRAFGIGTQETAKYVETVVAEMNSNKIGSFVKHFPGYGNSSGDTHNDTDINDKSLEEIEQNDIPPFIAGIDAGADGIMVTHTVINSIDSTAPASLSPAVCDYIRNKLGFDGLIITDGLDMSAAINYCGKDDPALKAILAGADIALIPLNADESCQALIEAAYSGVLTEERIERSVKRILKLKIKLGLIQ